MISSFPVATLVGLSAVGLAQAAVSPLTPGGEPRVGDDLEIQWRKDDTGDWTNMQIDFMTGDNWNMVHLETVATDVDGTSEDSYDWTIPDVSIYSEIYFFQFTIEGNTSTAQWTTRFTIASEDGDTVEPPRQTQPNGDEIGWGVGSVIGGDAPTSTVSVSAEDTVPSSDSASMASAESTADEDDEDEESSSSASPTEESSSEASSTSSSSSSSSSEEASSSAEAENVNEEDEPEQDDSSATSNSVAAGAVMAVALLAGQALL